MRLLIKIWNIIMEFLFKLMLLFTFLGILANILFIQYNLIAEFNPSKVIIGGISLILMIITNLKVQGGKIL